MHTEFNFTGVIVSHDIPEVFKISDRVAMLANGVDCRGRTRQRNLSLRKIRVVRQFMHGDTEGPIPVL